MIAKVEGPRHWKEARRKRAIELKTEGWKQCDIARARGVSEAAVSRWLAGLHSRGPEAWRRLPRPRGPYKLTKEELALLPELLSYGAETYGFGGEGWTWARVAAFVRMVFGVTYHKAHLSRLLKQLGWTPQLPIERAAQRDESQIAQWRYHLARAQKKAAQEAATLIFIDESGFYLLPGRVRTYAPCGQTPCLRPF